MSMTTCRECGKEISSQAATCPHCGVARPAVCPPNPAKQELVGKLVFGAIAAAIALMFIGSKVDRQAPPALTNKRAAVDLCWQDHERAKLTLPPAEQRFIASTCLKLEEDVRSMTR